MSVWEPFRENPSLQAKKHWEPNLSSSAGWEQFTDRDGGRRRMASHCKAEERWGVRAVMEIQASDSGHTLTLTRGGVLTPDA